MLINDEPARHGSRAAHFAFPGIGHVRSGNPDYAWAPRDLDRP